MSVRPNATETPLRDLPGRGGARGEDGNRSGSLGALREGRGRSGLDPSSAVALALSAFWVLCAAGFLIFLPSGPEGGFAGLRLVAALVAIVLPVGLIWAVALTLRSVRILREEGVRLEAAVDAIRHAAAQQAQAGGSGLRPPVEAKLDEIARAQRQTEAAIARLGQAGSGTGFGAAFGGGPGGGLGPGSGGGGGVAAGPTPVGGPAARGAARSPLAPARATAPQDAAQPSLALGTPDDAGAEPIPNGEFIRALNFPEDERDAEGFRALRHALKDRFSAGLVRSAQDMLTLLAEDGIYMDDLAPDRARPEVWRRFAHGERGKGIAALGGVRDRSSLALTSGRMRQDPVFRDTAHHFLRKFDRAFTEFEPRASDAEIVALSETRTARAFMLLGRVSGTFD
jgi:hypothetical protein